MTKIISIEGNIGSGKSTLVEALRKNNVDNDKVLFLQEPVDIWNTIKDTEGNTMLVKFYGNTKKYSFAFQMMAYISRLSLIKKALKEDYEIIVVERSMFTDKMVFAKMLYDDGNIEDVEYQIYNMWFHNFIQDLPDIEVVYVKTDPTVAETRVKKRGREGETIPLQYLENCHKYHEDWLNSYDKNIITLDGNIDIDENPDIVETWLKTCKNFMEIDNIPETIEKQYTLMFDGGSRGNPGLCGSGCVLYQNDEIVYEEGKVVSKHSTNNFAEYMSLIMGLRYCVQKKIQHLHVKGDSNLVIQQVLGKWKVNSKTLVPLCETAQKLLSSIPSVTCTHVKREHNKVADALANKAMDEYTED